MGSGRIIGADWAARYPGRFGYSRPHVSLTPGVAGTQRLPCPVCGHPTGDCTHDTEEQLMAQPSKPAAKKAPASKTAARKAAATDPATGVPAKATTAPQGPDRPGVAPDAPTQADGGGNDPSATVAATGASDAGTPIAPSGQVRTEMGYTPVGDTGAKNDHDLLAGGMPEASEALDAEVAEKVDEFTIRRRAFTDNGNETVTATRTVLVDFVPAHAIRKSTVQVFVKGQTYATADVARKLAYYDDRTSAEVRYAD